MSKDTQNAVIVLLSIVVVLVVVIGGGYWCFNYGDSIFIKDATNKTIIPKKKAKMDVGEYSISLNDNEVMILMEKIPSNRDKNIVADNIIYKAAYARNVVTIKDEYINIYEYYLYKDIEKDELGNTILYKYYIDKEKTEELATSVEENDNNIFDTNSEKIGMYKYSFRYDKKQGYVFDSVEKVR